MLAWDKIVETFKNCLKHSSIISFPSDSRLNKSMFNTSNNTANQHKKNVIQEITSNQIKQNNTICFPAIYKPLNNINLIKMIKLYYTVGKTSSSLADVKVFNQLFYCLRLPRTTFFCLLSINSYPLRYSPMIFIKKKCRLNNFLFLQSKELPKYFTSRFIYLLERIIYFSLFFFLH